MKVPPVSVIVVSRHRPALLQRALTALAQQDHDQIEVIVVADPEAARQVRARGVPVRLVEFDEANVAKARNAGLVLAGGPVVAFLDDDAVPEPCWASRLVAPLGDDRVTQAGGYVRGRNGISFQWKAMEVDATGQDHPLDLPWTVTLHAGSAQRAIKTQGTNCAFRRDTLLAVGGFDPAFRFYLDDADVNLRLAAHGGLTAVVPLAQVHHGFAASDRRRADRAPRSLHDIGASAALFLRRHAPDRIGPALDALCKTQRSRLLRGMQDGLLEPRDVKRLLLTLDAGITEGRAARLADPVPLICRGAFEPAPGTGPRRRHIVAGPSWKARKLSRKAEKTVAEGAVVTVLRFGFIPLRHRVWFDPAGYWCQSGGLFAPSDRNDAPFRLWGWQDRVAREVRRLQSLHQTDTVPNTGCLYARQPASNPALQRNDSEMSDSRCIRVLDRQMAGAYVSPYPAVSPSG